MADEPNKRLGAQPAAHVVILLAAVSAWFAWRGAFVVKLADVETREFAMAMYERATAAVFVLGVVAAVLVDVTRRHRGFIAVGLLALSCGCAVFAEADDVDVLLAGAALVVVGKALVVPAVLGRWAQTVRQAAPGLVAFVALEFWVHNFAGFAGGLLNLALAGPAVGVFPVAALGAVWRLAPVPPSMPSTSSGDTGLVVTGLGGLLCVALWSSSIEQAFLGINLAQPGLATSAVYGATSLLAPMVLVFAKALSRRQVLMAGGALVGAWLALLLVDSDSAGTAVAAFFVGETAQVVLWVAVMASLVAAAPERWLSTTFALASCASALAMVVMAADECVEGQPVVWGIALTATLLGWMRRAHLSA